MRVQHLANVTNCKMLNIIRLEFVNIITQPGEIDDRESDIIAFIVNAVMYVIVGKFYISIQENSFFVCSICFIQLQICQIYIRDASH